MYTLESGDPATQERYLALLEKLDQLPDWEITERQRRLPRQTVDRNRYTKLIMSVLEIGMEPVTKWWIIDKLQTNGHYVSPTCIKSALIQMEKGDEIRTGKKGNLKTYWLPCKRKAFAIGDPVCELKGTRSQQHGIILRFQRHATQGLCPVVQFESGQIRFSNEDLLEPVQQNSPAIHENWRKNLC